jgi:hypothetical protein
MLAAMASPRCCSPRLVRRGMVGVPRRFAWRVAGGHGAEAQAVREEA